MGTDDTHAPLSGPEAEGDLGRRAAAVVLGLALAAGGAGADTWLTPARGPSTQVGWAAPPSSSGSNGSGTGQMRVGGGRVSLAGDPDDGGQISLAGDPDDGGQLALIVHEPA